MNQRLRMGLIGAGGRGVVTLGRLVAQEFAQDCELAAVADTNLERANAAFDFLRVKGDVYERAEDLLDRTDIDAVIITTPDYLHEAHGLAALEAGKAVLMDKPLATTARGCLRLIEAAARAEKLLYMGFNLRHVPHLARLKEIADSGALGTIFSVHAIEHYHGGRTYMARWNRLRSHSGGLFVHKGSHDFDVINWLMGPARPVRVSCFGNVFSLNAAGLPFPLRNGVKPGPACSVCAYADACPDGYRFGEEWTPCLAPDLHAKYARMWGEAAARKDGYHKDLCIYLSDKDTHDQGIATVEYDNGATASHAEYFATPLSNRLYFVEGTRGHAEADLAANRVEVRPRWTQDAIRYEISRNGGSHLGSDQRMVGEFIACLRGVRRPLADGRDGAWSVAIGEAAEISRTEHRMVEIAEVLDTRSDLLRNTAARAR